MASLSEDENEIEESEDLANKEDLFGIRDGVLFVIDATPSMFAQDENQEIPYFLQSIKQYKEILLQKLASNRQDWMGLILFGVEKGDQDTNMENILTLQKLDLASVESLKQVMEIDEGRKWEYYRDIAGTNVYPLHDVLWHAARIFCSVKVNMPIRKVILFTCQDNPPMTNDDEKRRIVVKAKSYSDIGLKLSVVGLGENWNHDLFYKDLEISSGKIDREDYKRTSLNDLVQQIKLPSKNMAKLPWRLGENVVIDVNLRSLSVKREYLKKVHISKSSNEPLILNSCFMVENSDSTKYALEVDIRKYKEYGGKKINFTLPEVKTLCSVCEPGIDLICAKPFSYQPLYHLGKPYFVIPAKSNRKDNTLLFGALIDKCNSKNLMMICAVTLRKRSSPVLYSMIPNIEKGGFYLHEIPFKEYVRNLEGVSSNYIYDNDEKKPPTEPNVIEVLEKIIKKLRKHYHPTLFSNPKLQAELQMVKTLALDLEPPGQLPDDTLPQIDEMREVAKDPLNAYNDIFNDEIACKTDEPARKKVKKESEIVKENAALQSEESIRKFVEARKLPTMTVSDLKTICKTVDLKVSGKKDELIQRIEEHYEHDF